MPKLISVKNGRGAEKGSALIAVVMLSLVVAVAGVGYLKFMANTVHNEVQVLNDAESYQACESGMVLGCSWLELGTGANYFHVINLAAGAVDSNVIPGLVVNGYTVTVNIRNDTGKAKILAMANSSSVTGYNMQLSAHLKLSQLSTGAFGVWAKNPTHMGNGNTQGFCPQWFDGPMRFNTAMQLNNICWGNMPTFHGPVIVTNCNPSTGLPVVDSAYGTGHNGNDYRFGITATNNIFWCNPTATIFDQIFLSTFRLAVPAESLCLNSQGETAITLSSSSSKKKFIFGVSGGNPCYTYYNSSGNLTTVQYSATAATIMHIVGSPVSVCGSVKGNVNLYTDAGYAITVCDSIVYADFTHKSNLALADSATNFGIGFGSTNLLALESGADIIIKDTCKSFVITAQLFAHRTDTSSFQFASSQYTVTLIGCQGQGQLWCGKSGNSNASFNYYWDRRQSSAPGLGFIGKGSNGNLFYTVGLSDWCKTKQ